MREIRNYLEEYKVLLFLTGIGIFVDIFILKLILDTPILFLIGLWILSIWVHRFEARISIVGGLIFMAMCPFLLMMELELFVEKTAIWAFIFLVVGVGQMIVEYIRKEKRDAREQK